MAGEAISGTSTDDEGSIPNRRGRRRGFSPWLRMGAALRKGAADPRREGYAIGW